MYRASPERNLIPRSGTHEPPDALESWWPEPTCSGEATRAGPREQGPFRWGEDEADFRSIAEALPAAGPSRR